MNTEHIIKTFKQKVNILIVDDDPTIVKNISHCLCSPIIKIHKSLSKHDAIKKINTQIEPWACWILDIDLGNDESGLDILQKYSHFPFSIMLSGLRSMTIGTKAMHNGALEVFDKDPDSLGLLLHEVCKIATLGFILQGKKTQYLSHFLVLLRNRIPSAVEWAKCNNISTRHLERICSIHSTLTPRFIVSLYHSLFFLLYKDTVLFNTGESNEFPDDFYNQHINFVNKNLNHYKQALFC